MNSYGLQVCTCPSGYTGVTCQYTSSCANSPCKNGGTCIDQTSNGGTFSCQCPGKLLKLISIWKFLLIFQKFLQPTSMAKTVRIALQLKHVVHQIWTQRLVKIGKHLVSVALVILII